MTRNCPPAFPVSATPRVPHPSPRERWALFFFPRAPFRLSRLVILSLPAVAGEARGPCAPSFASRRVGSFSFFPSRAFPPVTPRDPELAGCPILRPAKGGLFRFFPRRAVARSLWRPLPYARQQLAQSVSPGYAASQIPQRRRRDTPLRAAWRVAIPIATSLHVRIRKGCGS